VLLNCDIGERGADNQEDIRLMDYIDIANIACGGHAGDPDTIAVFKKIADEKGIRLSAHLSYPDRKNFGRTSMDLSRGSLFSSLDGQLALLPVKAIKFHGALYNDSCADAGLAEDLTKWLSGNGIEEIITMPGSELALKCEEAGIRVINEAFAERGYQYVHETGRLHLAPRTAAGAVLSDYKDAAEHSSLIIKSGKVRASLPDGDKGVFPLKADTLCIHSDSLIALRLAEFLHSELRGKGKGGETDASRLHIEFLSDGICFIKNAPLYGRQDRGISPGGAMDRFACDTGNIMLSNPPDAPSLEIILPPVIRFTADLFFILTGAPCSGTFLEQGNSKIPVNHAKVYTARKGDILRPGRRERGFRTYLSTREVLSSGKQKSPAGRERGNENFIVSWIDKEGYIRVIPGPEYHSLSNPEDFFSGMWRISEDSDSMGLRLSTAGNPLSTDLKGIISDPVADGTVQLTPSGPVILHRDRQTMGGYPRIFSVITPDLDLLAQYMPGEFIKFRMVTIEEARKAAAARTRVIKSLLKKFK